MPNTLSSADDLLDRWAQSVIDQIKARIAYYELKGCSPEVARKIVQEEVNSWMWGLACNPSPLGD